MFTVTGKIGNCRLKQAEQHKNSENVDFVCSLTSVCVMFLNSSDICEVIPIRSSISSKIRRQKRQLLLVVFIMMFESLLSDFQHFLKLVVNSLLLNLCNYVEFFVKYPKGTKLHSSLFNWLLFTK